MSYILVTNDDGVRAPGIVALASAMRMPASYISSPLATNQSRAPAATCEPRCKKSRSQKHSMPVTETGNMLVPSCAA